jgi:hypothetical protein
VATTVRRGVVTHANDVLLLVRADDTTGLSRMAEELRSVMTGFLAAMRG